jgi:phosphoribosylamine---glycine ligase
VKLLVLNLDSVGEGLALALRAAKAGHQVRLWLDPHNNPTTAEGFKGIERVKNWLSSAQWSDLIVPTGNHQFMPKLDALRKAGMKVFGPSAASANLEVKRAQGMKFFEKAGIEVPEYEQFNSLKEAEAHVRKTEERYVFKTLGDEDDKSLSYVGKTPADMIARLQRWQKLGMNPKGPVMLQQFVAGIELGVSSWMGSEGFIGKPNENFEFKKLLSGNCGPNCGEAGTVMKYVEKSPLAEQVLYPMEDALMKLGHLGDIDVNCIVDEQGKAWPLEFTCRLGWPAANIMWASHKGDPVEWMLEACEGKDTLEVSPMVACGVVLAQPDYPYSKKTKAETDGIPIYGVTGENQKYISPQSVKIVSQPNMEGEKLTEKPTWTTTGDYICVTTALGRTVKQACERAYKTVKELHIPDMIYRDDIGEKLEKELEELHKHGFASEFEYG